MEQTAEKIALVTGASRGLGAALAEALAPAHHVIAVARTTGALEELDDRIRARGGAATLAPMDIGVEAAMEQLAGSVASRWGGVDLWVHAAIHAAPLGPAAHLDEKDWQRTLGTNLTATRRLIGLIEPLLLARAGTAVFFDDPRGGQKFFGHYGTSKAAQMALVRSWRAETVRTGPRVLVLEPAAMATATRARFFPGEDRAPLASPAAEAARLLPEILG